VPEWYDPTVGVSQLKKCEWVGRPITVGGSTHPQKTT
jgi:hypothetical protein